MQFPSGDGMDNLRDLGHRVLWTFVETFCGFLIAEPIIEAIGGTINLPLWQTAVGSSVAAAIVPVKEFARQRLNQRNADPLEAHRFTHPPRA